VTVVAQGSTVITYTDINGCNITATVTVNALPTITGTLNVCNVAGATTQLTGSGTPSLTNPWGSANTAVATVNNAGLATVVAPGTTIITYTDINGCSVTSTVTVNALPSAAITPDPAAIFASGSLNMNGNPSGGSGVYTTHLWTGTGAAYLRHPNIQDPVFSGALAGTYTLVYTVTDSNGCIGTDNITVTVTALPIAAITPDPAVLCADGSLNMNGNPSGGSGVYTTHLWTGTGTAYLSNLNIQNPVFSGAPAGTYTLIYTVTDSNGGVGTSATVYVVVNPLPTTSAIYHR